MGILQQSIFCELKESQRSQVKEFTAFLPMGASLEAESSLVVHGRKSTCKAGGFDHRLRKSPALNSF